MNGNDLGEAVFDVITTTGMSQDEKDALLVELQKVYSAVVTYIVANMGIKGVKVDATGVLSTPTTPVPIVNDGGAAILATMTANTIKDITQSNDGTGLVD